VRAFKRDDRRVSLFSIAMTIWRNRGQKSCLEVKIIVLGSVNWCLIACCEFRSEGSGVFGVKGIDFLKVSFLNVFDHIFVARVKTAG
jgi:hypothetical protein